ncbi:MAG: flagellar export chaperone FliS [Treponema sp.]|nr:flagellar export chaperone FliS [Treponema sp.]
MAYKSALSTYRETKVTTAGQGQLIIMLYNEATKHLDEALQILETDESGKMSPGSIEKFGKAVVKAQEIITELMVSLDFDQGGDIAKNLFSLYTWFNRELIEANISRDAHRISNVRTLIDDLRSAWLTIVSTGASEAVGREVVGISIAG